jgi:cytochrome c oxidase accessory protein FixG
LLDGVFRRIERLIEGPRTAHIRRDGGPATFGRTLRKLAKHVAFIATAVFIAHVILSYFASLPAVFRMVRAAPSQHPEAFAWVLAISAALYGNFAFFREQLCVVLCPYGRLQSVLLDDDSLIIGYDARRGEPRGHKGAKGAGDCVDCAKCVAVCPTGIDIRDGLQLDCIACTACIDACDDVMDRLGRSRGLIRYDSARGLAGQSRRVIRPRMVLYTAMLVVGAVAAYLALRARRDFEANVVRLPGAPFTLEGDLVRNGFDIHVVNKVSRRAGYDVDVRVPGTASAVLSTSHVDLDPLAQGHIVVFVTASRNEPLHSRPVRVRVTRTDTPSDVVVADAMLLGTR